MSKQPENNEVAPGPLASMQLAVGEFDLKKLSDTNVYVRPTDRRKTDCLVGNVCLDIHGGFDIMDVEVQFINVYTLSELLTLAGKRKEDYYKVALILRETDGQLKIYLDVADAPVTHYARVYTTNRYLSPMDVLANPSMVSGDYSYLYRNGEQPGELHNDIIETVGADFALSGVGFKLKSNTPVSVIEQVLFGASSIVLEVNTNGEWYSDQTLLVTPTLYHHDEQLARAVTTDIEKVSQIGRTIHRDDLSLGILLDTLYMDAIDIQLNRNADRLKHVIPRMLHHAVAIMVKLDIHPYVVVKESRPAEPTTLSYGSKLAMFRLQETLISFSSLPSTILNAEVGELDQLLSIEERGVMSSKILTALRAALPNIL